MKSNFKVLVMLALCRPLLSYAQGGRNFDTVQVEVEEGPGQHLPCRWRRRNTTVQVGADGVLLWTTVRADGPKIIAAVRTFRQACPLHY